MNSIKILGVPFHFGQPHAGVKFAPEALRINGLFSELSEIAPVADLGDIDFSLIQDTPSELGIKNIHQVSLANELISQCIEAEDLSDSFLLNIGGDHGMALGTIHGLLRKNSNQVIVWADAHGDINTPDTSPSGNFHGMPLSFLLGLCTEPFSWLKETLKSNKLIFFGPRDLDQGELDIIRNHSIQYYSSKDIGIWGVDKIMSHALKKADPYGRCDIHLSFDVDLFDACDVQATGTRVKNGPEVESVMRMGEILGQTGRLKSMDLVEINPSLADSSDTEETLQLAKDFVRNTLRETFIKRIEPKVLEPINLTA